jgi:hypothetical protein
VTDTPGIDPCGSCTGVRPGSDTTPKAQAGSYAEDGTRWAITVASPRPWRIRPAGQPAAVRSILRSVITLAEQAADLSDQQLRSRLAALGGLVR